MCNSTHTLEKSGSTEERPQINYAVGEIKGVSCFYNRTLVVSKIFGDSGTCQVSLRLEVRNLKEEVKWRSKLVSAASWSHEKKSSEYSNTNLLSL